jgi:hypothetical protein
LFVFGFCAKLGENFANKNKNMLSLLGVWGWGILLKAFRKFVENP